MASTIFEIKFTAYSTGEKSIIKAGHRNYKEFITTILENETIDELYVKRFEPQE